MRNKSLAKLPVYLDYLYALALALPYKTLARTKCKELLALAGKNQCALGKLKKTICKRCRCIMIPRATCVSRFTRKDNGFGLQVVCNECHWEQFTVLRGK